MHAAPLHKHDWLCSTPLRERHGFQCDILPPSHPLLESKYRIGTHDVPGEEWNKANRAYEAALRAWQADQATLQGAAAKGNKKEVKELTAKLSEDTQLE